jgi:hypothetical protein
MYGHSGKAQPARGSRLADRLPAMKLLRFLILAIPDLLKGIATELVPGLSNIFKDLLAALRAICARQKLPHADKNATNEDCGPIRHPSFHRPDPLIYSQQYLQKLGLAITWDNPDIILLKDGNPVPEGSLLPDTDYEIDTTIWNNSYDAPAVGVGVDFAFYSFGAGTTLNPIGNKTVNLGVKGGANHPAHARIKWHTPPAGHYCILVTLKWADDFNPDNNVGQNNVNVVSPQSPAVFGFKLKNDTGKPQRYRFQTDTYTLPALKDCGKTIEKARDNDKKWKDIQAAHNPANFPVPPGWTVAIAPAELPLDTDAEADIEVTITPPAGFTGRQAFNVHSIFGNGQHAGGVTVYVTAP